MATRKENVQLKGRLVTNPAQPDWENGPGTVFRFVEEDFKRDAEGKLERDEKGHPVVAKRAFHDAVVWRGPLAERINDTLRSGDSFLAVADLNFKTFTDNEGKERTSHEFVVKALGPDIMSGRVSINRAQQAPAATQAPQVQPVVEPSVAPAR